MKQINKQTKKVDYDYSEGNHCIVTFTREKRKSDNRKRLIGRTRNNMVAFLDKTISEFVKPNTQWLCKIEKNNETFLIVSTIEFLKGKEEIKKDIRDKAKLLAEKYAKKE